MMKKMIPLLFSATVLTMFITGCGSAAPTQNTAANSASEIISTQESTSKSSVDNASSSETNSEEAIAPALEDGIYLADFETDSAMFHLNETVDGKGTLSVKDGQMTIHISLVSKNIVNLYPGTADEAQKDGAVWLEPTTDTIDYGDGTTDEVYGFDVPVPVLDEEFDLALIGTKGKWYDHSVSVSNPVPVE